MNRCRTPISAFKLGYHCYGYRQHEETAREQELRDNDYGHLHMHASLTMLIRPLTERVSVRRYRRLRRSASSDGPKLVRLVRCCRRGFVVPLEDPLVSGRTVEVVARRSPSTWRTSFVKRRLSSMGRRSRRASSFGSLIQPSMGMPLADVRRKA